MARRASGRQSAPVSAEGCSRDTAAAVDRELLVCEWAAFSWKTRGRLFVGLAVERQNGEASEQPADGVAAFSLPAPLSSSKQVTAVVCSWSAAT
jgi:hypothetical protein